MKTATKLLMLFCLLSWSKQVVAKPLSTDVPPKPNESMLFIENVGQITDQNSKVRLDIDFKLQTSDLNVFISSGKIHYQWSKLQYPEQLCGNPTILLPGSVQTYRMDVTLEGADLTKEPVRENYDSYLETYYDHLHPEGVTAHSFRKICYKDIYPNIDWVLYVSSLDSGEAVLKYDFVVHPGGKASDITIRYEGATGLSLESNNLVAITPLGSIKEHAPYCYTSESATQVPSSFKLNDNVLSFNVGNYNGTLVIDPQLAFGTYYGGPSYESITGIAIDSAENTYLCGATASGSNIATTGSFQNTYTGGYDGFVVKFNVNNQRLWGTYFGGIDDDYARAIAIDVNRSAYVVGGTNSTSGIATTGSHQSVSNGSSSSNGYQEAFIIKFNEFGQRVWGTYYGGTDGDEASSVAYDKKLNCILVSGSTRSSTDIATTLAHQNSYAGNMDGMLIKMDTAGARLWATYFGGNWIDGYAIVTSDTSGNIYMTGKTASTSNIVTAGAFQTTYGGGSSDPFLAKFSSGGTLQWCTYSGGNDLDEGLTIRCDDSSNIYIGGLTNSTNNIATVGTSQTSKGGGAYDGFVIKFNSQGTRIWGTYYGGSGADVVSSIDLDKNRNVYAVGNTGSANNISTTGAYQTSYGGGMADAYIGKFNNSGQKVWSSYYGGSYIDVFMCIRYNKTSGNMLAAGHSGSTNNIATPGSYQPAKSGSPSDYDGFIASFVVDTVVSISQPFFDTSLCQGQTFSLSYSTSYPFNPGNVFTAFLSDASGNFGNPVVIGTSSATTSGVITCTIPMNAVPGSMYRICLSASNPGFLSRDNGIDIKVQQPSAPSVNITASKLNTGIWNDITFTANVVNGGLNPAFQWRKNGIDIPGATSNIYTAVTGKDVFTNDQICVFVTSASKCAIPDTALSNCLSVTVNLNVSQSNGKSDLQVYPIPTSGLIYIDGIQESVSIILTDIIGEKIYSYANVQGIRQIDLSMLPDATYILHMVNRNGERTVRKVIKRH